MDQEEFSGLFKDLMNHLYDQAALETHLLTRLLHPPAGQRGSRAAYLQQIIRQAIEDLRPSGGESAPGAPAWRPYVILHRRYVDGVSPQVLANELHLSERQLRRDHSRALQALAGKLWDEHFGPLLESAPPQAEEKQGEGWDFPLSPEPLDLKAVVEGVLQTLQPRLEAEGLRLEVNLPSAPQFILADRVLLRQILFSLCSYAMALQAKGQIWLGVAAAGRKATVEIKAAVGKGWSEEEAKEERDWLASGRYWAKRLGAELSGPEIGGGKVRLRLTLPGIQPPLILLVDDQQPTLRLYQRYLSHTPFSVIGVANPQQALSLTRLLKPSLVLLDVMMPHVDGWEILQALRAESETRDVPVVICSAWEAGEMGRALGAADFLKKPVTQKGLLAALERLGLSVSDKRDESLPPAA